MTYRGEGGDSSGRSETRKERRWHDLRRCLRRSGYLFLRRKRKLPASRRTTMRGSEFGSITGSGEGKSARRKSDVLWKRESDRIESNDLFPRWRHIEERLHDAQQSCIGGNELRRKTRFISRNS